MRALGIPSGQGVEFIEIVNLEVKQLKTRADTSRSRILEVIQSASRSDVGI